MSTPMSCVLVTGAAGGAGRVIAERFADAGAKVWAVDVSAEAVDRLARERPDIEARQLDVASEAAIHGLFDAIEAAHGGLDVLVNNVGIGGPTAACEDISLADWERTLAVNLTSHFLTARRAIPAMKARGQGLIVNISSASAKVGLPLRTPYVVTKAAVLSLTQNLARELGPFGIRVNAILPGAIEGDRMRRIIDEKAAALGRQPEDYAREMFEFISLRTMVTPDDIAAAILFLASPGGRRISGQMIGVDGHVEYER